MERFLLPYVLQGAACMNNTFCLGVFMFLIYFRSLAWEFSAETVTILLVQVGGFSVWVYITWYDVQTGYVDRWSRTSV